MNSIVPPRRSKLLNRYLRKIKASCVGRHFLFGEMYRLPRSRHGSGWMMNHGPPGVCNMNYHARTWPVVTTDWERSGQGYSDRMIGLARTCTLLSESPGAYMQPLSWRCQSY